MEIAELIRELRLAHSLGKGRPLSQGGLADLINDRFRTALTRETISRWERGRVVPSAYHLRHLSAVLDVPLAVFEGQLDRRKFITDLAGTAIAPILASDLLSEGFEARLKGGPSGEEWESKLSVYGTDYMSLGAADIQRRVTAELVTLQQQPDTPHLWSVAARLMTLYAKTFPGSDGARAVHWYLMAARAADASGDETTRVWVRGRAAIALGYEGASLPIADTVGQQAVEIGTRPSLGLLNAIMGQAHAAALRGDLDRARELDTQGRHIFDGVGSAEQTSDYAVPWWRMNVFRSLLLARLGDEHGAVDAQDQAIRELPPDLPRFATHLDLHKGLMIARSGDREGGIAHAQGAMDTLPPAKHSLTLRMLMEEIRRP